MSTRNQLADVNAVVASSVAIDQTDTFARLELADGHGDIVGRIDPVNRLVYLLAQCNILLRKPVSFKGPDGLLSSPC
jgi:hypothetical protein